MRTLPPPARPPALAARRPAPRAPRRRAAPAVASSAADADYAALKGVTVYRPDDGTAVDLLSTFKAGPGDRTVLVALTHCADLAPQELVPKLVRGREKGGERERGGREKKKHIAMMFSNIPLTVETS